MIGEPEAREARDTTYEGDHIKNPCPSLQDESESSSLCKKRKTSQIQPPISLKDRLVWPKVKDEDCTEINMIYPPIRPQHRNSPDPHNVISQIVQNAPNRPCWKGSSLARFFSDEGVGSAVDCAPQRKKVSIRSGVRIPRGTML